MPVTAVVGAAWGDEGKGKITDALAADAGVVARFQGGRNAGHTIVNDLGRFALHLLPSGVFRPGVTNLLGPGVAVDPAALLEELDGLAAAGRAGAGSGDLGPGPGGPAHPRDRRPLRGGAPRGQGLRLHPRRHGAALTPTSASRWVCGWEISSIGTGCGSASAVPWPRATSSSATSTAAGR